MGAYLQSNLHPCALLLNEQRPRADWLALRYDASHGMWWNLDSMLPPAQGTLVTGKQDALCIATSMLDATFFDATMVVQSIGHGIRYVPP